MAAEASTAAAVSTAAAAATGSDPSGMKLFQEHFRQRGRSLTAADIR
jgi:hypothetical protein